MYRYSPPKSNIWGHLLRKMEPTRQKALFDDFLKRAVAEYSKSNGSLQLFAGPAPAFLRLEMRGMWEHVTRKDVERFEQLFGTTARNDFFELTAQQCEIALAELIQNSALIPGSMLAQGINISKWLIEGQPVGTQSRFHLYYGIRPAISTFLEFETTAHFEFIKRVLSDLGFCKLSEKHLKPIKRGLKKKSGEKDNG